METRLFLAFDLGAESGRTVLGRLSGGRIHTRELTRFPNAPVHVLGHQHWNIYGLFEEIKKGIRAGLAEAGRQLESLAVDTWGVDFGLLAGDGTILGLPYAYRDDRTNGAMEEFFKRLPRENVYERTGIQFMPFNSLFQLFVTARDNPALLERAEILLFMPDLFTFLLTGEKASEFTIASTSQILDPRLRTWDETILSVLGLSSQIMPDVLAAGTMIGTLLPSVSEETGLQETPVIATSSHDTAAAVAAIPASGEDWAYISSGTWSLMGVELQSPLISPRSLAANFTNEGGVAGTIRFLKNIAGLWLLRQCRKEWSKSTGLSYDELTRMAGEAVPFKVFVDPDCPDFLNPPSMPEAIRRFCLRTGQVLPLSPAETVRGILESLAFKYRYTLDQVRLLTARPIERIHVIGGGSRNELLCRFTADATNLTVLAGPAEATATGNIMVQALALGYVGSLSEIRAIVRNSVNVRTYQPAGRADWDRAYERFRDVTGL
ncbi:MAG TPA: rhamnulokinase family protein [Candidatus Desulfaltia sp.]|nr:rhamnulokinase family protein [Candidatus Desulfaltia sp.]